jgi:hypothetical protein
MKTARSLHSMTKTETTMSKERCPITDDEFDTDEDHHWVVEDEFRGEKKFAGRVGIENLEDYIREHYPVGAYRAVLCNEDATAIDYDETERLFSIQQSDGDVILSTGVDAEGASGNQLAMYNQMAKIFEDRFELFVQKNLDYDSSFLSAGKVEQALDNGDGPFDSVEEANLYKLFTRIQDKNQRFYSLAFTDNEDRVGEAAAETAGDAAVYWFMVQWLLENEVQND